MKILILAENLEVNRTSSGITCNNQISIYDSFNDVTVLTSTAFQDFRQKDSIRYKFLDLNQINKSFLEDITKLSAIPAFINGLNFKARSIVNKWAQEIKNILKSNDYDLVVSMGSGLSFMPAYAMLKVDKYLYGKYMMFVHDPYPSHQYPPPYEKKSSLLYRKQAQLFGKALSKADIISFPSLRLMEWMNEFYPNVNNKSIIQPHLGLTQNELKNILPEQKKGELPKFYSGLNIVHTGTLLGPRNPLYLIKALKLLFKKEPKAKDVFHLHIIGKMTKEWYKEKLTADNVHTHAHRYTYLESLEIQKKADVLLLLEAVSDVSPFMPGKLADYLMAEKPILALTPKASETTRILGNDYPLLVENGNIEKIYEKLLLLYKSYKNDTLKNLIPSSDSYEYVLPKNWYKSLKMLSK
ncbi:glycosyltransferase family protein [Psychroflexus sediminis]|uniref:Uncharacterized protein n=1 Tax=Psychroflexus sediminis TaxID=470826 RepID=A0A1G7Z4G7_9FLAO|nr:glycosyltransferase [Psychroflexus sediminis]SDH03613.1 hypothetical protein SAMN04488027_11816 [Psychroflexus sediminis]